MKNLKPILAMTAAALALLAQGASAQSTGSLDHGVVQRAQAGGQSLNTYEQGLFNAINAYRAQHNLPAFQLDPSLIEPARYETMDLVKLGDYRLGAYLADGVTPITYTQLATDFGANTNGIADSVFDNESFIYDTPVVYGGNHTETNSDGSMVINWWQSNVNAASLLKDYVEYDWEIKPIINSAAITRIGIGAFTDRTIPTYLGHIPVIHWALMTGNGPVSAPQPAPAPQPISSPTINGSASASPATVTGTTTLLSVSANDPQGDSLSYSWSASGPAPVTFSANNSSSASDVSATFSQAGNYNFTVKATDSAGLSASSSVSVTVQQSLSRITISPASATLTVGQTQQFSASGNDQFGNSANVSPNWNVQTGSLNSSALYTATTAGNGISLSASQNGINASATITVNAPAPVSLPSSPPSSQYQTLVNDGLDPQCVSAALEGGEAMNTYEQGLFNAINAYRAQHNLPAFQLDPSLIEPARYETMDLVKLGDYRLGAYLADGVTPITYTQLATDFGANTNGIADSVFDNESFIYDTPVVYGGIHTETNSDGSMVINWWQPNANAACLLKDYVEYDWEIKPIINSATVTRIGIGAFSNATIPTYLGHIPVIHWALLVGK